MNFEFEKCKSGKPKGAMCDNESHIGFGLFKNVSQLKLTYQVRLLAYRAVKEDKFLMIKVPEICELSLPLLELQRTLLTDDNQERIRILRVT